MKMFFLLLFFSKTTLLTVSPTTINDKALTINLSKTISAITDGASLLIDISSMINGINKKPIRQIRSEVKEKFDKLVLTAELFGENGSVQLTFSGHTLIQKNKVLLTLQSNEKLSKRGEWNKLKIISSEELQNVNVLWRNHTI